MPDNRTKGVLNVQHGNGAATTVIDNVEKFSYSSDVLAVGDQTTFDVTLDQQGTAFSTLRGGATVRLYLYNEAVNAGQPTLKHLGIITDKDAGVKRGTIHVTSADLGWHLQNCHYGIWKSLKTCTLKDLLDPQGPHNQAPEVAPGSDGSQFVYWIEPSFGFNGLRPNSSNEINRGLRLGRAQALAEQTNLLTPIFAIQTEPGMTPFDNALKYAQRANLLVGTTVDGWIQLWTPDYKRPAQYHFECDPGSTATNCEDIQIHDTISSVYTAVTCVGEKLDTKFFADNQNPNAAHLRGDIYVTPYTSAQPVLPFVHRCTFGDGEMWNTDMAEGMAFWKYKRGIWDSHYLTVIASDHYQMCSDGGKPVGVWYESDMMCTVTAPHLGLKNAPYYIATVMCESDPKAGDTTTLTLRLPGFLTPSFGVWPTPHLYAKEQAQKYTASTTPVGP